MKLHAKYIVNEKGKPTSVIIPIDKFREIVETYGIDLIEEEKESISKGKTLRKRNDKDELEREYTDLDNI
ncbi:MAG: hypothetical protein IIC76_11475 [Bacteroidetes bacterium]|nr:hypothetical protein [Bacteroidota bacterium]